MDHGDPLASLPIQIPHKFLWHSSSLANIMFVHEATTTASKLLNIHHTLSAQVCMHTYVNKCVRVHKIISAGWRLMSLLCTRNELYTLKHRITCTWYFTKYSISTCITAIKLIHFSVSKISVTEWGLNLYAYNSW